MEIRKEMRDSGIFTWSLGFFPEDYGLENVPSQASVNWSKQGRVLCLFHKSLMAWSQESRYQGLLSQWS